CGRAPEAGFIEEAADFVAKKNAGEMRQARLRASPESFIERVFPPAAPLAGLIAPRRLLLRAPRGGFQKLARCMVPAATFHTRARRIG
ncbi:MAG: hypothetical protein ACREDJ_04385, partial [Methylocella sp.]